MQVDRSDVLEATQYFDVMETVIPDEFKSWFGERTVELEESGH